jgi:lipopolysaccharide export system protein LptA
MDPLLASIALGVSAEKADRDKPMNIEADALRYDEAKKISVFTGRVVLNKGSIQIRGERVEVRQDPQGFQYGVVTAEPGKRAFFRQKREGLDQYIEGEGATIDYDGRADTVKFIGQAQMRRLQGNVLSDEFNAGVIVYNNTSEVFTLDGGSLGPTSSESGRVRAMLTPSRANIAASAPAAVLRSSTQLGGTTP